MRRRSICCRKDLPIICQPADAASIQEAGFTAVNPVETQDIWHRIQIDRTAGQHGTGEIGKLMGTVSGFVLRAPGEPSLYLAGDTIWCPEVETALQTFQPDVVVLNAGAAQFLTGDPITMTAEDVVQVCRALPTARVIAVHMETINHCLLTRADLRDRLAQEGLSQQVQVPADGELIELQHAVCLCYNAGDDASETGDGSVIFQLRVFSRGFADSLADSKSSGGVDDRCERLLLAQGQPALHVLNG